MITTLAFIVCMAGLAVYCVTTEKTWRQFWEDVARISFAAGLLVVLLIAMRTSVL